MLHIKRTRKRLKLIAGSDYASNVVGTPVATVKDTGNGLIFKFPTHSSINQDNYVCIDYSEAHYMWLLLIEMQDKLGFCEEEIGSAYGE